MKSAKFLDEHLRIPSNPGFVISYQFIDDFHMTNLFVLQFVSFEYSSIVDVVLLVLCCDKPNGGGGYHYRQKMKPNYYR